MGDTGSMPDFDRPNEPKPDAGEESLTADVSADVAPVVDEFLGEAALANEAEADAAQDELSFHSGAGLEAADGPQHVDLLVLGHGQRPPARSSRQNGLR